MNRTIIAVIAALACGSAAAVNYVGPPLHAGKPSGPVFHSPLPTQGGIPGPRVGPMGGPSMLPPITGTNGGPAFGPPLAPSPKLSPPRLR